MPSEVVAAAPQSMLSVAAFGGESHFSHPAKPAKAPASWRPEWTIKLRTKSTYMGMLGMNTDEMMGGRSGGDENAVQQEQQQPASKKKKLKKALGKILGQ